MAVPRNEPYPQGMVKLLIPEQGKELVVRFLPIKGKKFYAMWALHFRCGPKKNRIIPCLREMFKEPCFICEQIAKMPDKARWQFEPSTKYCANVMLPLDPASGVHLLSVPQEIWTKIKGYLDDPQWGAIEDTEKGYPIKLVAAKRADQWVVKISKESRPMGKPELLDKVYDLSRLYLIMGYELQKKVWEGRTGQQGQGQAPAQNQPPMQAQQASARPETASKAEPKHEAALPGHSEPPVMKVSIEWRPRCYGQHGATDSRCGECAWKRDCEALAVLVQKMVEFGRGSK